MGEGQYFCPTCVKPLTKTQSPQGLVWDCENCSHSMVGLSVLKKTTDPYFVNHLYQEAKAAPAREGGACPVCAKPMVVLPQEGGLSYQICVSCEMIWMGGAEKAALPPVPAPEAVEDISKLPPKAAEMAARLDARIDMERGGSQPSEWDWVFWLFGLPTQPGGKDWVRFPRMTVILVVATFVISIVSPASITNLLTIGWVNPAMTWTSHYDFYQFCFLQLPLSETLACLYFLVFFGASVENKVGPTPLLTLFLLPTLLNLCLSLLPGFHMGAPIAASGGVTAIMMFFAFAFPHRKIFWRFGSCRAVYLVVFWVLFQFIFFFIPFLNGNGTSYGSDLIGSFCGWAYWFFMGKKLGMDWNQEDRWLGEE
jgi:membrane associated rhomboid family serine protease/ribosomal protein L37AE/L43A